MKPKEIIISLLATIILGAFVIFICSNRKTNTEPQNVYEVFLNGKSVGLLDSKDDLLALVDDKQKEIKDKYNVEKVYPPATLKTIENEINKLNSEQAVQGSEYSEIFDTIKDSLDVISSFLTDEKNFYSKIMLRSIYNKIESFDHLLFTSGYLGLNKNKLESIILNL